MRTWSYEKKPSTYLIEERVRQREYTECAVKDCWKPARGISQFCSMHHDRSCARGHPEAVSVSLGLLRRYTMRDAKRAVREHRKSPAVQDALLALQQLLDWGKRNGSHRWAKGREDDGKTRATLWLAHVDASPKELFQKIVAIYMLEHWYPHWFPYTPDRAVLKIAIGKIVLKSKSWAAGGPCGKRSWEWNAGGLTKAAAYWLGDRLHARIGLTAGKLAMGTLSET
jgi:hypothetical protein